MIRGVPVTVTGSENSTSIAMESPALYEPFNVLEVTPVTVGLVVSVVGVIVGVVVGVLVGVVVGVTVGV